MTDLAAPAFARTRTGSSRARAYVRLAAAYLVVYLALNALTDHRSLNGTAITLWSPDDALSVLLLMEFLDLCAGSLAGADRRRPHVQPCRPIPLR